MRCEIRDVNNFVSKEECVSEQEKLFNASVCKNGDETSRSNYQAISLLPGEYQILSSILLSR